ncbi:gliding motility protein GldB-related protein [Spirosoma fluviale]|uniref:DUF2268 domain-containing protein n=1 Tax=Spirosoma fluviale TaxID=1597977 RepID=A0A286GVT9_9BACT|nr:hypothetical protein [Spirosoma fluviale]SOD99611.1 hypothetical protein SAMN06269250_0074 [Spirosoma fluviale]
MSRIVLIVLVCYTSLAFAQTKPVISTIDITNFWLAFDQVQNESDSAKAVAIIKSSYVDQATKGLHYFIQSRHFKPVEWYQMIKSYPKYLTSIRPNTLRLATQEVQFNEVLNHFAQLYPAFKQPSIYFCIGTLSTGGTTKNGQILIGTEILIGDSTSNASELPAFFKSLLYSSPTKMLYLVAHEAVHTQQKTHGYGMKTPLLGHALLEGSCDFMAELLLERPVDFLPYINYGKTKRQALWQQFSKDLYSTSSDTRDQWFYNSLDYPVGQGDLGYFIGYEIAKRYYLNARDKKKAIKDILSIDCNSPKKVKKFLAKSGFNG